MCLDMISRNSDTEAVLKLYRGMTMLCLKSVVFIPKIIDHLLKMGREEISSSLNLGVAENLVIIARAHPDSFQPKHISLLFKFINDDLNLVGSRAQLSLAIAAISRYKILFQIFCKDKQVFDRLKTFLSITLLQNLKNNLGHSLPMVKLASIICYYYRDNIEIGPEFTANLESAANYILNVKAAKKV